MDDEPPPLADLRKAIRAFAGNFYWLFANRGHPPRWEVFKGQSRHLKSDGTGITRMLHSTPQVVIDEISTWYANTTGFSFEREELPIASNIGYRFTLHPKGSPGIDIDIVDTGEGMGQILPIIGLLALTRHGELGENPTFALEHPELHIHPDAHRHLAEVFCAAIESDSAPRFLIETHSETFLLGVQLAIATGKIDPADVIVHWVRGRPTGASIESIEFDKQARPLGDNWPPNVFQDRTRLARSLLDARTRK